MLGRFITGIQGISYTAQQEKTFVYGQTANPRAIQSGNRRYEGEIRLLQSELEALIAAAPKKDLLSLNFDLVVTYADKESTEVVTDLLKFCEISRIPKSMSQGDGFMEISLPILFMGVRYQR